MNHQQKNHTILEELIQRSDHKFLQMTKSGTSHSGTHTHVRMHTHTHMGCDRSNIKEN